MDTLNEDQRIDQAAKFIKDSNRILLITGAGVSAESGLPTYRGEGGLYNDGMTPDGIAIEEAISGRMMQKDPALCWKYLVQIEQSARNATFNRAHEVIALLEKEKPELFVFTQNVDSFHTMAGSKNTIEIHGNFRTLRCTHCHYTSETVDYRTISIPPICPECKKFLRPDVVLFGEMLPEEPLRRLRMESNKGFDLVISAGTSSVFPYITEPVFAAARSGKPTIEINPTGSEISHLFTINLAMPAGIALDRIYHRMLPY